MYYDCTFADPMNRTTGERTNCASSPMRRAVGGLIRHLNRLCDVPKVERKPRRAGEEGGASLDDQVSSVAVEIVEAGRASSVHLPLTVECEIDNKSRYEM